MAATKSKTRKTATTKGKTSKPAASRKATGKGKTTAAKPAAADGPSKRDLLAAQNAEHTTRIVEARTVEEMSWSDIAEELSITPGKAQYLMMCHMVGEGEVPAITHRNEGELVKKVAAARAKADEYSSWGWLSARTSVPENRLKKLMEESGSYAPKSENIAAIRAERNGTGTKKGNAPAKGKPATKATSKATKTDAKATTGKAAKTTAAKKRAAKASGKAKTS